MVDEEGVHPKVEQFGVRNHQLKTILMSPLNNRCRLTFSTIFLSSQMTVLIVEVKGAIRWRTWYCRWTLWWPKLT